MLNTKYLLTLFLTAALVTTACSNPATSPTSPSSSSSAATAPAGLTAERLAGTWTLSSLLAAGQAEQPVPSGAVYDLTFDNGRVAARTDCNVCNGGFTVSGETTTIGPALACTRAACPTMAFENAYTSILGGDSNVVVLSNTLTLTSSRGRLTFAR